MKINDEHYRLIHDCERRYGSLEKTPDKELRTLWIELYEPNGAFSEYDSRLIRQLAVKGYQTSEIAKIMEASLASISAFCGRHHVKLKKAFTLLICDNRGNRYWATTKFAVFQTVFHKAYPPNSETFHRAIVQAGLTAKELPEHKHWFELKNGEKYITVNGSFIKHGPDSYEKR